MYNFIVDDKVFICVCGCEEFIYDIHNMCYLCECDIIYRDNENRLMNANTGEILHHNITVQTVGKSIPVKNEPEASENTYIINNKYSEEQFTCKCNSSLFREHSTIIDTYKCIGCGKEYSYEALLTFDNGYKDEVSFNGAEIKLVEFKKRPDFKSIEKEIKEFRENIGKEIS